MGPSKVTFSHPGRTIEPTGARSGMGQEALFGAPESDDGFGSTPADISRTRNGPLLPLSTHCQMPARGFAGSFGGPVAEGRNRDPMPPSPPSLDTTAPSSTDVNVPIGARMIDPIEHLASSTPR